MTSKPKSPPELGAAPCHVCSFRERCGVERLACARFSGFLHGEPEWRWRGLPGAPTRARYEALLRQGIARYRCKYLT